MLRSDIVIAENLGFLCGVFQERPGPFGRGHIPERQNPGRPGDLIFQRMPEFQQIDPETQQGLTGYTPPLFQYGDCDMFRQQLIRIKMTRFFLGVNRYYPVSPLGKTF
jgi:hypothetical protein